MKEASEKSSEETPDVKKNKHKKRPVSKFKPVPGDPKTKEIVSEETVEADTDEVEIKKKSKRSRRTTAQKKSERDNKTPERYTP